MLFSWPLFQSNGMVTNSQMFVKRQFRAMAVVLTFDFKISAWMVSTLAAFLFFRDLYYFL